MCANIFTLVTLNVLSPLTGVQAWAFDVSSGFTRGVMSSTSFIIQGKFELIFQKKLQPPLPLDNNAILI